MAYKIAKTEAFVITRNFDTPRATMWTLWTDPEQMKNWLAPKGVKIEYSKVDLQVGGANHTCMSLPDGSKMWGKQVYQEIKKPNRLVYINSFSDEIGGLTRHPLSATWPLELLTTITFTENANQTNLKIEWIPVNASADEVRTFDEGRSSMDQGWSGTLDQLQEYLDR